MAVDISTEVRLTGGGLLSSSTTVESQTAGFGGAILPQLAYAYTYGVGDAQVNKWYLARRTLAGTTYDDLNLTTGLAALGVTQAFTKLRQVFVAIVDPDGTKRLRIGPQGRSNAATLWFQDKTTNFWVETYTHFDMQRPITGWTITATTADIFPIYNPGATSLTYAIWLMGN